MLLTKLEVQRDRTCVNVTYFVQNMTFVIGAIYQAV